MKMKKKQSNLVYFQRNWQLYSMLLIMIVALFVFCYWPMAGIQLAFKDYVIPFSNRPGGVWGSPWARDAEGNIDLLKHFKTLFTNPLVYPKMINTVKISVLRFICGFPMPILLAILLNELTSSGFRKTVQSISYLPHFVSWVVIAGILKDMTVKDSPFMKFLEGAFGEQPAFFADDNLFITMLIISGIWKGVGWGTIIYFAALTAIDPEQYEAAMIDGANRWKRIRYITLPGILPAVTIQLIFHVSSLNSAGFDQIYNLYNPLVYEGADVLETYMFRTGVIGGDYSLGTAMGLFNSLISFILLISANLTVKRIGGEGIW